MGWKTGLEPATFGTTNRRSNQLSYIHRVKEGFIVAFRQLEKKKKGECHGSELRGGGWMG